jgi:hypothetical protein
MIGQRGVEVESMPANQHTIGSVTETRRAPPAGLLLAVCLLNVFPGPGTRNNQNGWIDV